MYGGYVRNIKDICSKKVYTEQRKIETESAGITIIHTLLDLYGGMIVKFIDCKEAEKLDTKNMHLYQLLPSHSKVMLQTASPYQALLILVDYISGMTDRFALDLYCKLIGVSPALGRMG
ncbi:MAG: hypothetical protein WAK69_03630 [Rhodoplanes sp.]